MAISIEEHISGFCKAVSEGRRTVNRDVLTVHEAYGKQVNQTFPLQNSLLDY